MAIVLLIHHRYIHRESQDYQRVNPEELKRCKGLCRFFQSDDVHKETFISMYIVLTLAFLSLYIVETIYQTKCYLFIEILNIVVLVVYFLLVSIMLFVYDPKFERHNVQNHEVWIICLLSVSNVLFVYDDICT